MIRLVIVMNNPRHIFLLSAMRGGDGDKDIIGTAISGKGFRRNCMLS